MSLSVRNRLDLACALLLFALSASLAFWTVGEFRRSGVRPEFYQAEFAPAVMLACGRGFTNVDWPNGPAMRAFLLQERPALSCGELGERRDVPLNALQNISVYLEWAVAITWRLAGISWDSVTWLTALLAGLFGAAAYGVMRLGMRPAIAALGTVVVVISPLHLSNVPQLRDYSKAPFLLALVLLMGLAVKRTLTGRQLLWLSALGGVVEGVGFGFRTDLLLATIPFLAVLFVFRAGSLPIRSRMMQGAAASAVFLASFAVIAAPVLAGYAKGGNAGHVVLLGFASSFNSELGVEAKHYELYAPYDDGFQEMVVRTYASSVDGDAHLSLTGTEAYDRESSRYLVSLIRTFPADAAVRAFSAALQIVNAPFSTRYARASVWVHSPLAKRLYAGEADALQRVGFLGWIAGAIVVAGVAASSVRQAAFLMFIVLFLGGGAAIQFHPRHMFHLEFMSWWVVGVVVDGVVAAAWAIPRVIRQAEWRSRERLTHLAAGAARSAAVVAVAVVAATVGLGGTRRYQQQQVGEMFERALASAATPLPMATMPNGKDGLSLSVDLPELVLDRERWATRSIAAAYLVIDVDPQRCDSWNFSALIRYQTTFPPADFTRVVSVPLVDSQLGSSVKILLPVYAVFFNLSYDGRNVQETRFTAIELSEANAGCVASIRKVGDLGAFPVLVTAVLGPDWRSASHYQTIAGIETREDGVAWHERLYRTREKLEIDRSAISRSTTDLWRDVAARSRAIIRMPPSAMAVAGTPETPYAYLVLTGERAISAGTCAVAVGDLAAGGLTFGMLRNGRWDQQVNIVERGGFVAAGCAQEDGNYAIVLANNNPAGGVTTARLMKFGWIDGAARLADPGQVVAR